MWRSYEPKSDCWTVSNRSLISEEGLLAIAGNRTLLLLTRQQSLLDFAPDSLEMEERLLTVQQPLLCVT